MNARIVASPNYSPNSHKFLELPPEIYELYENPSQNENAYLYIKGSSKDHAYLCTRNKTYHVRKQLHSNSLLLLKPAISLETSTDTNMDMEIEQEVRELEITDIIHSVYELILCIPNLEKLKDLLGTTPYKGPEEEKRYKGEKFYSWEELDDLLQASEEEIKCALEKHYALEVDGYWRFVETQYLYDVLVLILSAANIENMSLENMSFSRCAEALADDGIPSFITKHCLTCFADVIDYSNRLDPIVKLSKDKICSFIGLHLLRTEGKAWIYSDFIANWVIKIPDQWESILSFDLLKGNAIKEYNQQKECEYIELFAASDLSTDPEKRFRELFTFRSRWTLDDIRPFLDDIVDDSFQKLEDLLPKYTKQLKDENGQTLYQLKTTYFQ
ncbi:6525_t:CDS:2 [Ambispora leptoticha]|uniref:6525_t:CDS:1 n=1 Tax=Ambispora leptoticha TaxID=144679 RepID=A0A9N8WB34_9GLOM|nr:6525_t:CDS:2 [Ambispora leptoticha]